MLSRLVLSLLAGPEAPRALALKRLASELGRVVFYSEPLAFPGADFYAPEMGPGLTRRVAAFAGLRSSGELAGIKRRCMELEAELAVEGRRRVNLDPGLLGKDALVLATHKPGGHRLELAPGIHGEVTLFFRQGAYEPLPWTYLDYAAGPLNELLGSMRPRLLESLRRAGRQGEMV
ncbi:MAG: DUF4416 family protein [Desulfarculaceae bacterium]|nr:DUF4416 family protein [Desulfarculaceae bacterium]